MTALVDLSFFLNRLQTSIRRRETIGVSIENNVVTETRRNYAMWWFLQTLNTVHTSAYIYYTTITVILEY